MSNKVMISHDKQAQALYINLSGHKNVEKTVEAMKNLLIAYDIILDYDDNDKIIGIEILGVEEVEYESN